LNIQAISDTRIANNNTTNKEQEEFYGKFFHLVLNNAFFPPYNQEKERNRIIPCLLKQIGQ